ncbi:o-fucosyltransferase 13 [Quercus suber]|uniref:O-fucosyltransferase family protein n=1 Tax=Quercus suber TaxID=58331 RepID=A0AAW0LXS9_QUESU
MRPWFCQSLKWLHIGMNQEDDDGEGGIVREVVVVRVGSFGLPTRNLGLEVGIFGLHEGALKGGEGKHYPFITIWLHLSGFADVFDVDYFLQQMNEFIKVVKELPPEIASKEPFRVDCSKRKGQFDYIESVLPSLLEHHYISITPARSQRRDSAEKDKGLYKTHFLSRRAFAEFTSQGFSGRDLMQALWKAHLEDYVMGRGSALPDYFCEFKL